MCPLSLLYLVWLVFVCDVVAQRDSLAHPAGGSLGLCLPQCSFQRRVGRDETSELARGVSSRHYDV